jgi:translation initiation factor 2 subunit 2
MSEFEDADIAAMFQGKKKKKKAEKKEEEPQETKEPEESYDEMLSRIYVLMGETRDTTSVRSKLKPPKTEKVGSKKTAWTNFRQTCEGLNRTEEHLSSFISSELGTLVSVTQDGALLIRGIFPSMKLESCVKKYTELYVKCQMCKSTQTELRKDADTRLMMMHCNYCKATRSVTAITAGFHATTKADRKKAAQES